MGFFDDLDEELAIPHGEPLRDLPTDVDPILERLKTGWEFNTERRQPGQERRKDVQYQQVAIRWNGQRFEWTNRLLEGRGRSAVTSHSADQRTYDLQGMRDALADNPWVAQEAFRVLGIDISTPDF